MSKATANDTIITSVTAGTTTITSAGGTSVITVAGTNLADGITVTAFDGANATSITGTTTGNATSQTVTLTFPVNSSTSTDKVYTIKISLNGGDSWETNTTTVTVSKANEPLPNPEPIPPTFIPDPKPTQKQTEVLKDVETDGKAPETTLNNNVDELKNTVFTKEELSRIEAGENARIFLQIEDISENVSQEDKTKVEETLGDYTIGLYLDINLFKQIGSDDSIKLRNIDEKVSITIEIPEEFRSDNRDFKIIRIHDGAVLIIDGIYNPETGEFTFETDSFSTYALIYEDVEPETNTMEEIGGIIDEEPEDEFEDESVDGIGVEDEKIVLTEEKTETNKNPQTGVTMDLSVIFALSIISGAALLVKKRRDK